MLFGSPILRAAPITTNIAYSTTGWISSPYLPGVLTLPIGYAGVTGTLPDFHSIDLGRFVVLSTPGCVKGGA